MAYNCLYGALFAAIGALIIYASSISVISGSGFFKQASLNEPTKYKSSTLSIEQQTSTLQKLKEVMNSQKPYLKPSFSLPDLAKQLNLSVHVLSQVINDGLGRSFFEMLADYRIEEAKKLLEAHEADIAKLTTFSESFDYPLVLGV